MRRALLIAALLLAGCTSDAPRGDPVAGEFLASEVEPTCGFCHTLAAADFNGSTAPDLDQLRPGYERVRDALRVGPGLMPSYREALSDKEMHDIAAFVSKVAGR